MKRSSQPFHPGAFLRDKFLTPSNISQADFARKIGWRKERLNKLIRARCGITADAALDLADALGTSPKFWLQLQAEFDLATAERRRNAALW